MNSITNYLVKKTLTESRAGKLKRPAKLKPLPNKMDSANGSALLGKEITWLTESNISI